jgi:hypothetical protein
MRVESRSFLTNHARVLLRIAQDPGARLRDTAASPGITERSAHSILTDLTAAGYVVSTTFTCPAMSLRRGRGSRAFNDRPGRPGGGGRARAALDPLWPPRVKVRLRRKAGG